MADTEFISLCWKEFQKTTTTTFTNLHGKEDFTDITLVCNTGRQIKAHKIILSAVSSFFKTIFERNPHQHPLIYLKGISFEDLNYILDFIYLGEVKITQEELVTFLNVAEELQIDGLKRKEENQKPDNILNTKVSEELQLDGLQEQEENQKQDNTLDIKVESPGVQLIEGIMDSVTESIYNPVNSHVGTNKSLSCNNCDFTTRFKNNLNRHKSKFHVMSHQMEIESEKITCKYCGIKQTEKENLDIHMQLEHKNKIRKYPCDFSKCDYKANTKSNLKRHISKIHVGKPRNHNKKSYF